MSLNDLSVRKAKPAAKPYKLTDANGLYVLVNPNGSRYWRFKFRVHGVEKKLALGVYPTVGLQEARRKHMEARRLLSEGVDPSKRKADDKREARLSNKNSFQAVALEWLENRKHIWSTSYTNKLERLLARHVFPDLGAQAIRGITASDLLTMLRPIEARGTLEMAHRAKQVCGQVFGYAIATGRADRNPANDITGALKPPKVRHNPHLEAKDLPEFLNRLEHYHGDKQTQLAVKLILLTAVRTSELRGASWAEIDFEKKEWRIPRERMKTRKPHVVPLSNQAIEVLQELHRITGNMPFICSHRSNPHKCMSENTILYALYGMGYKDRLTTHGLRGTFSTILNEHGFNRDHIERQLAHVERDRVRASYNHSDYLAERRKMMQWWADYITQLGLASA